VSVSLARSLSSLTHGSAGFKVLSEAERTAALYSLLQHSTQVQIRFFITVLQQMARADPMTALLSPAVGSMQNQMEASFARLKSPGLKSNIPPSPTARAFAQNRQSLVLDNNNSNFLSPDSATNTPSTGPSSSSDAAATLAHQRAKLKANAAAAHPHRISAPVLASAVPDVRASWAAAATLAQVSESSPASQENVISRPKSSDFSGSLPSPHLGAAPTEGDSWASMVNTPSIPLFPKNSQSLDSSSKEWNNSSPSTVPRMSDPTIYRRKPPSDKPSDVASHQLYDDAGNPVNPASQPDQRSRNPSGMRSTSASWVNRGQVPSATSNSNPRFNNYNDDNNNINGLGMQFGNLHLGMSSSPLPSMPAAALTNLAGPINPFNMNVLNALTPEGQLLAAQLAASAQGYAPPAPWFNLQSMGYNHLGGGGRRPGGGSSGRSPALRTASSAVSSGGASASTPKGGEEDFDPALLNDVPAWLRSLRLHKYTTNFEGKKWQEIVVLDEAQLEEMGVAALGARRKMLKTFEVVRRKMGLEGGSGSVIDGTGSTSGGGDGANGNGMSAV